MQHDLILRTVAKLLIPFILLFALYVQFHGDFGPGGGFQAGVIFAAGIIFHGLVSGLDAARKVLPDAWVEAMMALGVLLYAGVGFAGIALGGAFLDYSVLSHDAIHGQHRGIFWVEVGVALTVCGVMLKIFYMFAARGRVDAQDQQQQDVLQQDMQQDALQDDLHHQARPQDVRQHGAAAAANRQIEDPRDPAR